MEQNKIIIKPSRQNIKCNGIEMKRPLFDGLSSPRPIGGLLLAVSPELLPTNDRAANINTQQTLTE